MFSIDYLKIAHNNSDEFIIIIILPFTDITKPADSERGGLPLSVQTTVKARLFICS